MDAVRVTLDHMQAWIDRTVHAVDARGALELAAVQMAASPIDGNISETTRRMLRPSSFDAGIAILNIVVYREELEEIMSDMTRIMATVVYAIRDDLYDARVYGAYVETMSARLDSVERRLQALGRNIERAAPPL
jgi:hypothetical protein